MKTALITGCYGQDGSYLTQLLLSKNYIVYGIARQHSSSMDKELSDHFISDGYGSFREQSRRAIREGRLHVYHGDILDTVLIAKVLKICHFDEIYHLAAQSHVARSFETPLITSDINGIGTLRLLHAILDQPLQRNAKFYNACSSEVFGQAAEDPQTETTPFHPVSPYATAKVFGCWITSNYREAYGMFAVNGIMFNHESPRRGLSFVTRKITWGVALIVHGLKDHLLLGNLDTSRDWGHAAEYVEAMHAMLQLPEPQDIVVATGETRTVREFVQEAFRVAKRPIYWEGSGLDEVGKEVDTGIERVKIDASLYRPNDVMRLRGSPMKAEALLGWRSRVGFNDLVKEMTLADISNVCSRRRHRGRKSSNPSKKDSVSSRL